MTSNTVTLRVNGLVYGGWKKVRITRGIDRACADFALTVSERWPGMTTAQPIRPAQACQIYIGSDLALTGFIDDVSVEADDKEHTIEVRGRSKTMDIVDSSVATPPSQWLNSKLEAIAAAMAAPYGIKVVTQTDTGDPIPLHQVQQGETVFEAVDRMARFRAVIVTDDRNGNLLLTTAATNGIANGSLVTGANVKKIRATFSARDRFNAYEVKAQVPGTDFDFGEAASGPTGTAVDPAMRASRKLTVVAEVASDTKRCQQRAEWEKSVRFGRSISAEYRVNGWRQPNGSLWTENTLVPVRDAISHIDATLLISTVEYLLNDQDGMVCELNVGPKEAFELFAELDVNGIAALDIQPIGP
jgi:prophage tail gpP-like protein